MAGTGYNSNRGIGTGEAIVYDTSRTVNQYLQNASKIAQQQAMEQKLLQDDLAKVKIDGVRDADKPEYISKYNDWKDTYRKLSTERDQIKRSQLKSNFDKKELELQDMINDSKNLAKGEDAFTKILLTKDRDNYTDDTVQRFQVNKTLSRNDPNYVRDTLAYQRMPDLSKVDYQFRQIDTDLMSRQQESNPVTGAKVKVGNRMGTNLEYKTSVDPNAQAYNYALAIKNNKDMKYSAKKQYPELFNTLSEDEAIAQVAQDIASKRPLTKVRNQLVMDEADWRAKIDYQDAKIRARQENKKDESAIYRQDQINEIWNERNSASGVSNTVKRLKSVAGANATFNGTNINRMIRDSGRWINITVPARKIAYTTTDPEGNEIERYRKQDSYKVRIDKRNPQDKAKLNKVLDVLTGSKISEEKLQTGNAGGKIKGAIYTEQGSVPKSVTSKFKNVPKGGF